jgi:hypothetical protein
MIGVIRNHTPAHEEAMPINLSKQQTLTFTSQPFNWQTESIAHCRAEKTTLNTIR